MRDARSTSVECLVADTVGCPILRKTLCEYMLNRAELPGLWNKPPADCEIAAGVRVAEQEGIRWDQSTPGVWQQHAVAFLAPKRYYDEHYQKVLHAFLDDGLAIVTIEHRLDRLSEKPARKLRTSRQVLAAVRQICLGLAIFTIETWWRREPREQ